jgi:site-specific recombinase XerD
MIPNKRDELLALVESFFHSYLRNMRGASHHTIRSYRDALRLFFLFLARQGRQSVADLRLEDIQADAVVAFLDHSEARRGNCPATRNCRLAAIRSFAQHLLRHDVTRANQYGRILAISRKRKAVRPATYLEPESARAIIAAVDLRMAQGVRDRALLLFLYNTGARVSEALAIRPRDLRLGRPRQVRLQGKGNKERICPLWPETAAALRPMVTATSADEPIFRNACGPPLTRDGVAYLIDKYVSRAAKTLPALRRAHVTPHAFRHGCGVALLQAGVDLTVIRDYLGHASVATTSRYLTTNLKMKRDVLDAFWKRAGLQKRSHPRWRPSPKLLAFLESL